ncbi:MAG: histidine phosphatase family protein [Anaerolineae bacterium]|jgi:broad specificity phosphatase PhoE
MRFIAIRHGRPAWHSPRLISLAAFERLSVDYDDAHLSEDGARAVATLARQLPKVPILSSDLPRARETAEVIADGKQAIALDPVFREVPNTAIARGLLGKLRAPADLWAFVRRCFWIIGVGECPEKPRAAWGRASRAADEILEQGKRQKHVILVSHGWFLTVLALHLRWRGLIQRGPLLPRVGYGGMTVYHLRPPAGV